MIKKTIALLALIISGPTQSAIVLQSLSIDYYDGSYIDFVFSGNTEYAAGWNDVSSEVSSTSAYTDYNDNNFSSGGISDFDINVVNDVITGFNFTVTYSDGIYPIVFDENSYHYFEFFTDDAESISFDYTQVASVPVPASAWLFMSALVGLVGKKRLSRR